MKALLPVFLLVCTAWDQPEYPAVLTVVTKGSDGMLMAECEIKVPFVPQSGMYIDLFEVTKVTWSTNRRAFILTCRLINNPDIPARDILKVYSGVAEWKEHFFLKK